METIVGLKAAPWTPMVERLMEGATGSDPSYTVAELRQEVEAGQVHLFAVVEGGQEGGALLGYVCVWVDQFGGGSDLVIQAGVALQGEAGALAKAMPVFRSMARENGCTAIRVHVEGSKRMKLFKSVGFEHAEHVMRARV